MVDPALRTPASLFVAEVTDETTLAELYRTMLVPSFPADELISPDALVKGTHSGTTRVLLASSQEGEPLAGAVGEWWAGSRVQLLTYLVVRPGLRGLGIGSRLLAEVIQAWTAALRPTLIVGEVEDPRHHGPSRFGDPAARVRLYERFGARVLPVPYAMPALEPGKPRVPMMLTVFAADAEAHTSPECIDGGIIESFLVEYYRAYEGAPRPDEPRLGAMIEACRTEGGLPLLMSHDLPDYQFMD